MITFDNSFFFDRSYLNLNNDNLYKENLKKTKDAANALLEEFKNEKNEILQSFIKPYQERIRKIKQSINNKNKKKVVIGLGGSSAGAKALSFFLNDNVIFLDNLDFQYLQNFFSSNEMSEYIFFIISKSGDTFETLAILNLLVKESEKQKCNIYKSMVVITENKNSVLKNFADEYHVKFVEHNSNIGGRFSILSETGMLPFLNLNIKIEEASEKFLNFLNDNNELSPTLNVAVLMTCIQKYNLKIYCNLIYNYRLKHFSYWFHQLHAESLGKNGKGMTPITSICPKDHHSMMQLYLDGPKDKIFNIFSPPDENYYENFKNIGFKKIENYSPSSLLDKQFESVIEVFKKKQIPHRVIKLKNHRDPLNIIELFSFFILETILLGKVLGIDPYDQPSVQLIKEKI